MIVRMVSLAFLAMLLVAPATQASAQSRVALVIDNRQQTGSTAQVVANLKRLNYKVVYGEGLGYSAFIDRLQEFDRAQDGAEVALVYYTGPILSNEGRNILVGRDARPGTPLQSAGMVLDEVVRTMRASKANIVLLEAAVSDPLLDQMVGNAPGSRAMAQFDRRSQFMIAFSSMPGKIARSDTDGTFGRVLATQLARADHDWKSFASRVRHDVFEQSRGTLIPFMSYGIDNTDRIAALPPTITPGPRVETLSKVERAVFVQKVQTELKRLQCHSKPVNGDLDDALDGISELVKHHKSSQPPSLDVANADRHDFDSWLNWAERLRQPVCPSAPRNIAKPPVPKREQKVATPKPPPPPPPSPPARKPDPPPRQVSTPPRQAPERSSAPAARPSAPSGAPRILPPPS